MAEQDPAPNPGASRVGSSGCSEQEAFPCFFLASGGGGQTGIFLLFFLGSENEIKFLSLVLTGS